MSRRKSNVIKPGLELQQLGAALHAAAAKSALPGTNTAMPGTNLDAVSSDAILLRGEAAARARRIDLVSGVRAVPIDGAGLTAEEAADLELAEARRESRLEGFEHGLKTGLRQGKEEGLAEGVELGRAQRDEEEAVAAATMAELAERLEARIDEIGTSLSASTTDLALEIAKAVLARELFLAADPGADAIVRCLDLMPPLGTMVVRLCPEDIERLGHIPELGNRELVIVADESLQSGDAEVSVDEITVDARIASSLQRVSDALHQ